MMTDKEYYIASLKGDLCGVFDQIKDEDGPLASFTSASLLVEFITRSRAKLASGALLGVIDLDIYHSIIEILNKYENECVYGFGVEFRESIPKEEADEMRKKVISLIDDKRNLVNHNYVLVVKEPEPKKVTVEPTERDMWL